MTSYMGNAQGVPGVHCEFPFLGFGGRRVESTRTGSGGSWKGLGGWGQGQADSHNGLELSLPLGSHPL